MQSKRWTRPALVIGLVGSLLAPAMVALVHIAHTDQTVRFNLPTPLPVGGDITYWTQLPHVPANVLAEPLSGQLAQDGYRPIHGHVQRGPGSQHAYRSQVWAKSGWPFIQVDIIQRGSTPILGRMWLSRTNGWVQVAQHGYPAIVAAAAARLVLRLWRHSVGIAVCGRGLKSLPVNVHDTGGPGVVNLTFFYQFTPRSATCPALT